MIKLNNQTHILYVVQVKLNSSEEDDDCSDFNSEMISKFGKVCEWPRVVYEFEDDRTDGVNLISEYWNEYVFYSEEDAMKFRLAVARETKYYSCELTRIII